MSELADIRSALDREWAAFLVDRTPSGKWTQAGAWRRDNPGEWQRLQDYRAGGARPAMVNATGFSQQMLEHLDARRLTDPPPAPAGTLHLSWDRYEQVPGKYGSDTPYVRIRDVALPVMPPGVTTCMEVLVDGSDSTSANGDGTYALNGGGSPETWIQEGSETWESFYYLIPDGTDSRFPGTWRHSIISAGWNAFYEYHEPGIAPRSTIVGAWGSDPPVWQLAVAGGDPASPTDVWVRGPAIAFNTWHRFLFHWRWSRQNDGYVEAWINDVPWVTRSTENLLYGNPIFPNSLAYPICNNFPTAWNVGGATRGGYFEIGHYRGPSRSDAERTYMARIRVASTRELALA